MDVDRSERRLVAVDVDGTLLNTEVSDMLAPRETRAMDAVREAGHVLALCTGRNLNSLQGLLTKSDWGPTDLPLVLLNGAVVWAGNPRRCLARSVLEPELIRDLVRLFREHDTVPMVYGTDDDGGLLRYESRPVNDILGTYLGARRRNVGALEAVGDLLALEWGEALEVGTIDEKERVLALTEVIERRLAGRVKVINTRSLLGGGAYYWAEAFHADTDKGRGLRVLASHFGIPLERTVAIGDNFNDLDMFAAAGVSVAMAGSPDEVLMRSNLVTGHVADGGAAEILEQIARGEYPEPDERIRAEERPA